MNLTEININKYSFLIKKSNLEGEKKYDRMVKCCSGFDTLCRFFRG